MAAVADSERGQHGRQIPRLLLQLDRLVATSLPLELRAFHSQTVIHFRHTWIYPYPLVILRYKPVYDRPGYDPAGMNSLGKIAGMNSNWV